MNEQDFGYHAPTGPFVLLRGITRTGLGRGAIRKWIERRWLNNGWETTDVTVRGINYRLRVKDNTTDAKILTSSKFYDKPEIMALAQALEAPWTDDQESPPVFVDVGANTGYYSLNLARMGYSRVIAIEPNPTTIDALRYNIRINQLDDRITLVPLCIGSGETVPFYCSTGLGSASVFADQHNTAPISVPSMPLHEILLEQGVQRVGGMKIDIEGFEDQALFPFFEQAPQGLWPRVVVIEDCHEKSWQRNILEQMAQIGYRLQGKTRGNSIVRRNQP